MSPLETVFIVAKVNLSAKYVSSGIIAIKYCSNFRKDLFNRYHRKAKQITVTDGTTEEVMPDKSLTNLKINKFIK